MFKMYSEKRVKKLVERLREEYDAVLKEQREAAEALKTENAVLRARLLVLEGERGEVTAALVGAVREGERIKAENALVQENERKELQLLIEKYRTLSERLLAKYPDAEDAAEFAAFTAELQGEPESSAEEEEIEFDMDEVISPKGPLDLGKLCKDLGVMEDE